MQLYRRFDGTIITDDCPVGLRRIRDTWRRVKSVAAGAAAFLSGWTAIGCTEQRDGLG